MLSERGRDLYSVMVAFLRWGDIWLASGMGPPLLLHHTHCGHDFAPVVECSRCGSAVDAFDMEYSGGPGTPQDRAAGDTQPFAAAEVPTHPA